MNIWKFLQHFGQFPPVWSKLLAGTAPGRVEINLTNQRKVQFCVNQSEANTHQPHFIPALATNNRVKVISIESHDSGSHDVKNKVCHILSIVIALESVRFGVVEEYC